MMKHRLFLMETEFSRNGSSSNVCRHGLQDGYLISKPHVEGELLPLADCLFLL